MDRNNLLPSIPEDAPGSSLTEPTELKVTRRKAVVHAPVTKRLSSSSSTDESLQRVPSSPQLTDSSTSDPIGPTPRASQRDSEVVPAAKPLPATFKIFLGDGQVHSSFLNSKKTLREVLLRLEETRSDLNARSRIARDMDGIPVDIDRYLNELGITQITFLPADVVMKKSSSSPDIGSPPPGPTGRRQTMSSSGSTSSSKGLKVPKLPKLSTSKSREDIPSTSSQTARRASIEKRLSLEKTRPMTAREPSGGGPKTGRVFALSWLASVCLTLMGEGRHFDTSSLQNGASGSASPEKASESSKLTTLRALFTKVVVHKQRFRWSDGVDLFGSDLKTLLSFSGNPENIQTDPKAAVGMFPPEICVGIARPIAYALAAMHSYRFLHCGVSPGTVVLDKECAPMLSTFGWSQEVGTPIKHLVDKIIADNQMKDVGYLPPEVFEAVAETLDLQAQSGSAAAKKMGAKKHQRRTSKGIELDTPENSDDSWEVPADWYDTKKPVRVSKLDTVLGPGIDTWSLGMIMYEMASGRALYRPANGKARLDAAELWSVVDSGKLCLTKQMKQALKEWQPELGQLIIDCLNLEPTKRPPMLKIFYMLDDMCLEPSVPYEKNGDVSVPFVNKTIYKLLNKLENGDDYRAFVAEYAYDQTQRIESRNNITSKFAEYMKRKKSIGYIEKRLEQKTAYNRQASSARISRSHIVPPQLSAISAPGSPSGAISTESSSASTNAPSSPK